MTITPNSPFKAPPSITEDRWIQVLRDTGSLSSVPLWRGLGELYENTEEAARHLYRFIANKGHDPGVFLAIVGKEHTFGTNRDSVLWRSDTRSWTNARSVRDPAIKPRAVIVTDPVRQSDYVKYANVFDSVQDGIYRVEEPGYAYADAVSILDVIRIWAPGSDNNRPEQYAQTMADWLNEWGATDKEPSMDGRLVHVALAAGHWNTAGGNAEEKRTTRPLTFEIARQLRAHGGFRATVLTPESGDYPGDHNAVARAVVALDAREPVDLFLETHTEGVGNTSVRGAFGVIPWWPKDNPTDRDEDAQALSKLICERLTRETGLGVRAGYVIEPGVMAEYQTGVGTQGSRLGVFANTASAKATMTRIIVEYGAHTNTEDLAIQREPWFSERAARATVDAIAAFYRVPGRTPEPQASADNGTRLMPTGKRLLGGFRGEWEGLEQTGQDRALRFVGYPLTDEFRATLDGQERTVQVFERTSYIWFPENDQPWHVVAAPDEVDAEIRRQAREQGLLPEVEDAA